MNVLDGTPDNRPGLLASPRHTLTLFGIVAILLVAGAMNASHQLTASQAPDRARMLRTDLLMIGMQWLWVRFIYLGMRAHGSSILAFFESKALMPRKLAADCAWAASAFAIIYASTTGIEHLLPHPDAHANNPLLTLTPEGMLGITVWIALSLSAGICEEIVFRGYLQRQLASMTGKVGLAIAIQALVFGVGHAYEGLGSVLAIVVHGWVLGWLAHWRGNIRAGVIEHAGWDILVGLGLI